MLVNHSSSYLFDGAVVFVTGGASGIGAQIVKSFAESGATVCFVDINTERGVELVAECGAHFYEADVADSEALERTMQAVVDAYGNIDIVINNVGVSEFKPLTEISVEEFDRVISINLRSAFVTSRFMALTRNSDQGRLKYGRIINISSTRHQQSEPNSEAYAASKGGIVSLTHALAASFAGYNITVNAISPGWIHTGDHSELSADDRQQHFSSRVGDPSDIARICQFLCDPKNDFINGENITVDGGMTKKMIYCE